MSIKEIINSLPELFIFLVPGFIVIDIKREIRQEYKLDEKHLIIKSIVWSFIVVLISQIILSIKFLSSIKNNTTVYNFFLISLSVMVGYLTSMFPEFNWVKRIKTKLLKITTEPYPRIWNVALKAPKGAWAIVYFDDKDIAYIGQLLQYSSNPNYDNKEILLSNFKYFKISTNDIISDYTEDDNAYVYLDVRDVTRIEIFKG